MSIPSNHHFVSRAHINQFFNTEKKKIFLYDKKINNHYSKLTTKSVFSETDLNTQFINGQKDYTSLEKELNVYFEKDFPQNFGIVNDFIQNKMRTEQVDEALYYFARYGVIGDFLTPRYKQFVDDSLYNALSEIFTKNDPNPKSRLESIFEYKKEVKYSNEGSFLEISNQILSLMGGLAFAINIPENNDDYFVLPDCSAITVRAKINKYFNPDIQEIAYIGLPLSSKIYLHFFSEKLFKEKPVSRIIEIDSNEVKRLNKESLQISESKVACENQSYLKNLI